ncbi:MAG TPA: Rieske 2Fe-2S domain-containing protein [Thermoanaerobaculia bacterium]|nr:Rieske 2Fe-2S domain-containing protein [Thermoanaerobaculia bacterium]
MVPWWYMVAPSKTLAPGKILRFDLGDLPIVLFRGRQDCMIRALPAHCLHQGVDLKNGEVIGDCIRCPLHHWEYRHSRDYVVAEQYGMIFLHPGEFPLLPIPNFQSVDSETLCFEPGTAVDLDCPWYVPVANAFDMTHLRTVHRRELKTTPETTKPNAMTFVTRYATGVTGQSWSDRAMRLLSRNHIEVTVTCAGGTMIIIEATAGRQRSYMIVSLRPTREGVSILPLYAVARSRIGLHKIHAPLARILFTAFLRRDLKALRGIRFPASYVDPHDPTISACYRHLCELPAYRRDDEEVVSDAVSLSHRGRRLRD